MSSIPRWSRPAMIIPAHVPNTGVPPEAKARSGSARPSRSIPSVITVDSPPGMSRPSSPSRSPGTRTSRTSAPRSRRIRAWASTSPWRASTPTTGVTGLPAAAGEELLVLELPRLERLHRDAEPVGGGGDARRVPEVRRRLDDRPCAPVGILGLEDAGTDEHGLGAELHHQRGVGRGRDAAGGEERDGELALARDLLDDVDRRLVGLR